MLLKASGSPLSHLPDEFGLGSVKREPSPKEADRVKLFSLVISPYFLHCFALLVDCLGRRGSVNLRRKHGPTTVEAHVHRDLLLPVVRAYLGSVHSYDISNSLAYREVLKLPGKKYHGDGVNNTVIINLHGRICHFQSTDEFV